MTRKVIWVDGTNLGIEDVISVSKGDCYDIRIKKDAITKIKTSREFVETIMGRGEGLYGITTAEKLSRLKMIVERFEEKGKVAYGITTGFGELANIKIGLEDAIKLQYNLVRSHAAAIGEIMPFEIVRGAMLIRANTLTKGYSGVRLEVINHLINMLKNNIVPIVPEQGSVGASGDLAPSAHMALAMIGEGQVLYNHKVIDAKEAYRTVGMKPLDLKAKEGLAIINGTHFMTSYAAHALYLGEKIIKNALIAGAMSLEALYGTDRSLDPKIHNVRPHRGQKLAARILKKLVSKSEIIRSHRHCSRVQDAYSIRCMPQVFGPVIEAWNSAVNTIVREMNSAVDNPLVFADKGEIISGGNFHGAPIAMHMDFIAIALTTLTAMCERRIARLIDPHLSSLPPFLIEKSGLNSGYMIAQYTAAAITNENKTLSNPASVDTIPTSANQEDHVSMGMWSARKAYQVVKNSVRVVAIELLLASQALEFHKPYKPGKGTMAAYRAIRKKVPILEQDRVVHNDIKAVEDMIYKDIIINSVEKEIGGIDISLR